MSTLTERQESRGGLALPPLALITCLAVAALYLPTLYRLFSFGWDNADYSHGPLVLGAFLWLVWRERQALKEAMLDGGLQSAGACFGVASFLALLLGLACYGIGSSHGSMAIESFSVLPVLLGGGGYLFGRRFFRLSLFPVCFLIFLIPPPLVLTDLLTAPLKMLVATAAAAFLKVAGYLVSRNGATILMGDYSITVGDPCSGMRSLIALMSVGALYAHLLKSTPVKKSLLFCSTFPISVLANVVRLMMLCLITDYWGEAAAEGFLHKFSGFVLFAVSLCSLFLLDIALHRRRSGGN